jgi:hypothetical protein
MKLEKIRRVDALREMELKETHTGDAVYFQIQFYKRNGEMVTLSRARGCGLRADMTKNRLRGVQLVDVFGNAKGHIYPVSIDNIRTFNYKQVVI